MRFLIIHFALVFFSTIINAQSNTKTVVKRYLFHSHGISFQNFGHLNNRIKAYPQYEQLKTTTGTLQFGIFTVYKKIVIGYSGNFGSSLSGDKNKKSSSINFSGAAIDFGYNIIKTDRVSLFPFAGLGYEKFKASFNKDISTIAFDSVLASNNVRQSTQGLEFTNAFAVYRLGFAAFITSKKHPQNSFGLHLGYTGSFKEKDWKINNVQSLFNSPTDKLSKIFASIIIRYEFKKSK